jgi:hypothetical protein
MDDETKIGMLDLAEKHGLGGTTVRKMVRQLRQGKDFSDYKDLSTDAIRDTVVKKERTIRWFFMRDNVAFFETLPEDEHPKNDLAFNITKMKAYTGRKRIPLHNHRLYWGPKEYVEAAKR